MEITAANESAPVTEKDSSPTKLYPAPSPVDKALRWVTSILLLIFPTATLFLNRGDSYVLGLLTLIGIWVWLRDGARRWLDRPTALLWITFVLFFAVALLSYLLGTQTDAGFRFLGRYLRFLLVVPVYLALRHYPPTAKTVFIGLALGALLAGIIGGLQVYRADTFVRIEATTGLSIILGDLVATMVLCIVAGFALTATSTRTWTLPLLILCVAGGITATLLSGTRTAWVPLLLLVPILLTPFGGFLKRRYVYIIILILAAIFSSLYFIGRLEMQERIGDITQNLRAYAVSFRAATAANGAPSTYPRCDSTPAFLRAWLHESYLSATLKADAAVVQIDRSATVPACTTNYVVYLYNNSKVEVAYAAFPRVPYSSSPFQHSQLLLRGKGAITFNGVTKEEVKFDAQDFKPISAQSADQSGSTIYVFVPPQQGVWLAPIDGYFGEYSMSIAKNSVGMRLEMWRAAWYLFLRHPLLGVGVGAYQLSMVGLVAADKFSTVVADFDHPHNDYLHALASAGIVGFLALLAILLVPLVHFWHALRGQDMVVHAVGLAGALTVFGFAIYALTDTIFLHSMIITWYVVYMASFYALLSTQASKLTKPEPAKP